MKDQAVELVKKQTDPNQKLNILREYLQAYALRILHDQGFFRGVAFLGGTALRFIHGLPRFSEDLDFSLIDKKGYSFTALIEKLTKELTLSGYKVTRTFAEDRTVHSAMLKFSGLLKDTGISPMASQNVSIKLKVDTNPPAGARTQTAVVNKYFPVAFLTFDESSLFAGKTHALLSRKYIKGRDYFDLGWYVSKWKELQPNFLFLNNALKQTGYAGDPINQDNWREALSAVVAKTNWKQVTKDTERFLENPSDMAVFSKQNILGLLKREATTK
jgi:predicted nucleotidyltransferase component of viral defense system